MNTEEANQGASDNGATIEVVAPAKINLYLHVGAVRADGLHDLESLFVFADDGDLITIRSASNLTLKIEGPFADELRKFPVEENLVGCAATKLRDECGVVAGADMVLHKRLPIAAGVGGGSSDAAAALRALIRLWDIQIDERSLQGLAFELGADVPACLDRFPVLVSGAGERLSRGPKLQALWVTLVNPNIPMPTGPVFAAFDREHTAPPAPKSPLMPPILTVEDVKSLLAETRNDLQAAALGEAPLIGQVIDFMAKSEGALGARLSGSGATVFTVFTSERHAQQGARAARSYGWWAMAAKISTGENRPG